jgi:hypothetical protein
VQVERQVLGLGGAHLPWEEGGSNPGILEALGVLREPVLALVRRDPQERPTMAEFCRLCNVLISVSTLAPLPGSMER